MVTKLETFHRLVAGISKVPVSKAKEALLEFEKGCPQKRLEPKEGGNGIEAYLMAPKKGADW